MDNSKFKDSSFSEQGKTPEKITYKGDLRIVGRVVDPFGDDKEIGYVIMTEKSIKFKMYTVEQTKMLLSKFKFVNAELVNGNIINTECAMSRLPKFSTYMSPLGDKAITILGEIHNKDGKAGYRILTSYGKVVDTDSKELIQLYNSGYDLINAKVVGRGGKEPIISAIKTEFTVIEQLEKPSAKINSKQKWIYKKHIDKLLNYAMEQCIRCYLSGKGNSFNTKLYSRFEDKISGFSGTQLDLDREARIIEREIYNKGIIGLSQDDKLKLKAINKRVPHHSVVGLVDGKYVNSTEEDNLFFFLVCQFALNDEKIRNNVIKKVNKLSNKNISMISKTYLKCDTLAYTIEEIARKIEEKESNVGLRVTKYKPLETTKFTTGKEVAELGFAIHSENANIKYKTKTNGTKTLKYLGYYIPMYDDLKGKARCLGDLLIAAYINKILNGNCTYMSIEDERACIEMLIVIAYIYGSELVRDYVDKNKSALLEKGVNIPDYKELSTTDFRLSNELKLYYTSGLTVFLKDNRKYKTTNLAKAKFINYRQLGNKYSINHDMITSELASVVSMVTSDNCNNMLIDKWIGRLRFI